MAFAKVAVHVFPHQIHNRHLDSPTMSRTPVNQRQIMISIRMQRPNLNRTAIPKTHTVIANRNLPQPVPQMEPLACPHIHHHTVIAMDRMQCSLIPHPQSIKHTTNTNKHKTLKHNWHSLRLHPINCRLFSWNIHTIKWNPVFFTSMKKFSVFQRKKKFSNTKMNHTLYWKLLSVRLYVIFNTFQLYTENCHRKIICI